MKAIIAIIASIVSVSAQADIIKCNFTEPFISFQYSMTQSAVELVDYSYDPAKKTTVKNVSMQVKGPGYFELWNKNNQVIATLTLDNNGSDGMSDNRYPYSIQWKNMYGGCTSNFLPIIPNGWN